MLNPQLANAADLDAWADRLEAQSVFPRLIRQLLVASGVVRGLSVRSGEGVLVPGWDGRFEVFGDHPLLPRGHCLLEVGTSADVRGKAQDDYSKRTGATPADIRADTTFVVATPRRWGRKGGKDDKATWLAERRAAGEWKGVVALDADDLETLLDTSPSVHVWISELLGKSPLEVQTLESWWRSWSSQTSPPLPTGLLLAGRNNQREELMARLANGGIIGVRAESREEALAFVAAAFAATPEDSDRMQHALVVETPTVWARLAAQRPSALLIPMFEPADVGPAANAGHTVLIAAGPADTDGDALLRLPRPSRQEASDALVASGLSRQRAEDLARQARVSLLAVRRQLATNPRHNKPKWAREEAGLVARLMLAGSWSIESQADADMVGQIAGFSYAQAEEALVRWSLSEDPPLSRSGGIWRLAAPLDAWSLVGHALGRSDMDRWAEVTFAVLAEPDPTYDLPAGEQGFAAVYGVARRWSPALHLGLAQSVALLGSVDGERLADGSIAAEHAQTMVYRILSHANEDPTGRRWQSLGDVLPLLAEAAPEEFLRACEDALQQPDLLKALFLDDAANRWGSSPHTALLWALEGLAWSPELLPRVTHVLAGLVAIDPGGTMSNRPANSLANIFLPWHPSTAASPAQRLESVRGLLARVPDVGWHLVISILPQTQGFAFPTHRPRFRDWAPDDARTTMREFAEATAGLFELAFQAVDEDPRRWLPLLDRLADAPPDALDRGLAKLEAVEPAQLDDSLALELWETLHSLIAKHRAYPDARWSLDGGALARLEAIETSVKPARTALTSAYLFESLPDLPGVDKLNLAAYEKLLQELRHAAVARILEEEGFKGLLETAARSEEPWWVGVSAGEAVGETVADGVLDALGTTSKANIVASGWVSRMRGLRGGNWAKAFAERLADRPADARIAFCRVLPQDPVTWKLVDRLPPAEQATYWDGLQVQWVASEHVTEFASRATEHRRPLLAMEVLSRNGLGARAADRAAVIAEAMLAALKADERTPTSLSGWSVGRLLDLLEEAGTDLNTMVTLELGFEEVTHFDRPPRALHGAMLAQPSLFVEAVTSTYRPDDGSESAEATETERQRAGVLYSVLTSLKALPGAREDGTIDQRALTAWVAQARSALAESHRAKIGDHCIGEVLSSSPVGDDGVWPAEAVRDLIETIASPDLESGMQVGHYNARGITSRSPYEGGVQEEALVDQFREGAERLAGC